MSNFVQGKKQARSLFRQIWRVAPHSTQYSKPAYWTIRRKLKEAYRDESVVLSADTLRRGENTLKVLESAKRRGPEHKLVANLCAVSRERGYTEGYTPRNKQMRATQEQANEAYDQTIRMLNESMHLALR